MKCKIFLSFKYHFLSLFFTLFLLGWLIFFSIMKGNQTSNLMIDIPFYGLIAVNFLWIIVLHSLYQTRIAINEKELYAPFFIWYPNFKIEANDVFSIKTISFNDIESIERQQIFSEPDNKTIPILIVKLRNKYDLCITLDAYNDQKIIEIEDSIKNNISCFHSLK